MDFNFEWASVGDTKSGRPTLGGKIDLVYYRLAMFSVKSILEAQLGPEKADEVFYRAGDAAGRAVYHKYLKGIKNLNEIVQRLAAFFHEHNIGIFRIEKSNETSGEFVFSMLEDVDCSGTADVGKPRCKFDEGLIAGILGAYLGREVAVREDECWGAGGKVCRFEAKAK